MPGTFLKKNYAILLRCPYGDEDSWIVLQDRSETIEEVLAIPWDFECSVHGVQRELPVAANQKGPPLSRPASRRRAAAATKAPGAKQRSSARLSLKIPVQVYGWVRSQGAFHEEATTSVVNSGGCLVFLDTKVEMGDSLFVVNRASGRELECRVAYIESESLGAKVGLAFKSPAEGFWRIQRQRPRFAKSLRVWVRGLDRKGDPFLQSAYTIDISEKGARLEGLGGLTSTGETIEVKHGWRKARYRVTWIGPPGTATANQVGLCCMEESNIWGGALPASGKHKS
jgi:hypothetical protein